MPGYIDPGELIVAIAFSATLAVTVGFWVIELWATSADRVRDVWATVRADWRRRRAERKAWRDVNAHPNVVIRIRRSWESR